MLEFYDAFLEISEEAVNEFHITESGSFKMPELVELYATPAREPRLTEASTNVQSCPCDWSAGMTRQPGPHRAQKSRMCFTHQARVELGAHAVVSGPRAGSSSENQLNDPGDTLFYRNTKAKITKIIPKGSRVQSALALAVVLEKCAQEKSPEACFRKKDSEQNLAPL